MNQKHNNITENACYVYFLHDQESGKVKIGWSANPLARQIGLQIGNPNELILLGTMPGGAKEEEKLHRLFSSEHKRGEWFHATDKVLETIRRLLVIRGRPRTVQDELDRRKLCRFGLRGVQVAIKDHGLIAFHVLSSRWDFRNNLLLKVIPSEFEGMPEEVEKDVPADRCFLLSDWPVTCHCWCE